jgi:mono/diheme cytochrome c family protein
MKIYYKLFLVAGCIVATQVIVSLSGCSSPPKPEEKPAMTKEQMVERGKYLATIASCNDCHSPKIMTKDGPVADGSRLLSGSPSDMKLPAIHADEITPGKWYLGSADLTAWVGPWGISYAANLTPDSATGSGTWSEELFIKILRSGKFMGIESGRPIMPPMPWNYINQMTDDDLKSVLAYLKSLPPIKNSVHAYVPPNEMASVQ